MTKEIVWASRAMVDSTLVKRLTSDKLEKSDRDRFMEAMKRRDAGLVFPPEMAPKKLFEKDGKTLARLPEFFEGGSYCIVSAELAEVLRRFDLGDSALYPVEVCQHDRQTPVEGAYYCLSFGARKETFLPEQSERARQRFPGKDIWAVPSTVKDGEITLRETALEGPDLWMETPRLAKTFFLSGRLVHALKEAKLTRRLGLRRCRVIRDH